MRTFLSPRSLVPSTLFALAGLAAGCVDDGTELYSEEGELVGGTATAVRPEIGSFWNGVNGSCTATLVSPQTVLLAAHCMAQPYTATTVPAGAVFMFTDGNGIPQNVPVDRVHTFSTKRWETIPSGAFTTDVSLLHLATAVPPSQAVPAALAMQEPYSGEQSTMFGFGCTDRTPQSGGGFKQFFTFNYGTPTTALCWGDSGGPAVFGPQTGTGAVWGVNSDFNVGWDIGWLFPDGWTDMWAAVPFYKKQIEDITRGWDGADERGMNRPGLDYDNLIASTVAACRTACENDGNCRAFTWVPEGGSGRCWRKSGAPELVPTATAGVVSGLPRRLEVGVNRWGGDYAGFWSPSAEACSGACGRDHNCQAFTYEGSTCWLKSSVPAASACTTCTSGVPRRALEVGINRGGFDIATHTAATARACADLCARNDRCEAYTHTSAPTNNCWLKDAVPNASVASGVTSGVRRSHETNTYRGGTPLTSFWTGHKSPAVCQVACANNASCASWSYQPPPTNGNDAACFLFSDVGPRYTFTGYVSGVKGLEFMP